MNPVFNNHNQELVESSSSVRALLYQVFAWFAVGILTSGAFASIAATMPIFRSTGVMLVLMLVQLGVVVLLSSTLMTWSYAAIQVLFLAYCILSGLTLSVLAQVYKLNTLVQVFFVSAGMFAGMALYGWYTKADLSRYRSLLTMTLWGVIIALVVNMFLGSTLLDTIVALVGVLLFSALTAYDIQRIQHMARFLLERDEMWHKIALSCALQLYLDFINLFLSILRLWGRDR